MKKVHVGKTDSAASVISKVIKSSDDIIVVYIPKGTKFSKSRNNFILLKREARTAGKDIAIESVDEQVLEMASMSGLQAANPFFGQRKRSVSDIVTVPSESEEPEEELEEPKKKRKKEKKKAKKKRKLGRRKVEVSGREEFDELHVNSTYLDDESREIAQEFVEDELEPVGDEEIILPAPKKKRFRKEKKSKREKRGRKKKAGKLKKVIIVSGFVVVLGVAGYVIATVLPQVTITLDFEKTNWDFVGSLDVSASIEESSFANDIVSVRGVSFAERNTLTKTYPATGEDFVEQKAKGTITIVNEFSSASQGLVKTTRFETSDGKIYRLDEDVTVPGAKVAGGVITPSTIEASVTADKPGSEFNIGPVEKFTIPGFAGSSKFDGFYGKSSSSMTGGSSGDSKVPTEEDINAARDDIKSALESASRAQLTLNLPPDLKILDGSHHFSIIDEDISPVADSNGMFTVTARGESKLVGFNEEELLGIFKERIESDTGVDMAIKEFSVEYGEPEVTEDGDGLTVALNFTSVWSRPFDVDQFKNSAVNLDEAELKTLIFSVPGVQGGEVRFWPFWVRTVPDNLDKIIVDVE